MRGFGPLFSRKNRYILLLVFGLGVFCGFGAYYIFGPMHVTDTNNIAIIHSPQTGNEIINVIDSANRTIDIEVYLLTSKGVISSLERAKERGVRVRIILEKRVIGGANQNAFDTLKAHNISVRWASNVFTLTHSKIIVVDGKIIIVGSHNLSYSALNKNREISLLVLDENIANKLDAIFEEDWLLASDVYGR